MSVWQQEVESALDACVEAFALAGVPLTRDLIEVEFLPAPHTPRSMPSQRMAVYGFWWNGEWLKIGKAGPRSGPRYLSQHYHLSAPSSLARSLKSDLSMHGVGGLDPANPGLWIRQSTSRVNILVPATLSPLYLSFVEAFLHLRMHPRYEGYW